MYELTCPSCQNAQRSPFVRANAVMRCPNCGHVWRISESHFVRRAPNAPAPAVAPPEPELKQDDASTPDPMGGSSVTGLSGLSDIMQAEPAQISPQITGTEPTPVQQAKLAPSAASSAPRRPDPAATRQPRRTAILVIAAFAAFIAIAGIALAVMFNTDGGDEAVDPPSDTGAADADPASSTDLLPQGPPSPDTVRED